MSYLDAVGSLLSGWVALEQGKRDAANIELQADIEARQMKFNEKLVRFRAQQLQRRAHDKARKEVPREVARVVGEQKAAFAAQGVEVGSGIAAAMVDETKELGAIDAMTIKNNAAREAFGLEISALDMGFQRELNRMDAANRANASIATGGLRFASGVIGAAGEGFRTYNKNNPKKAGSKT